MIIFVVASQNSKDRQVEFILSGAALYVANGGRPFTRKGVIGICASHLSEKHQIDPQDNFDPDDEHLVEKIRAREVATYKNDINRLRADAKDEQETSKDYGGRFVWELLQNADDAMGEWPISSVLIGSKGLGFKAILEITDDPEVHSGPFHFKFSPSMTQEMIKREIGTDTPPMTFRIPHHASMDDLTSTLLQQGYSTVIKLPFRDDKAREIVLSALTSLSPRFLLFSNQIDALLISLDGQLRRMSIKREIDGLASGIAQLALEDQDGLRNKVFRRWVHIRPPEEDMDKRLSIAICLPLDDAGIPEPFEEPPPLFVFYPTEETVEARALIHCSFDLQESRKHTRKGNYDELLVSDAGSLLRLALDELPARTALEAFTVNQPNGSGSPITQLQAAIRQTLSFTAFVPVIGGHRAAPPEVKLWDGELGPILREEIDEVKCENLLAPELTALSPTLKDAWGSKDIGTLTYLRLLSYCRNDSMEACHQALNVLLTHGCWKLSQFSFVNKEQAAKLMRVIPCFWTEKGIHRTLTGTMPLLLSHPEEWPTWLNADFLHPSMNQAIDAWEKSHPADSSRGSSSDAQTRTAWNELIRDHLLRKSDEFLEFCLIPEISTWDTAKWVSDGWRVLRLLMAWPPPLDESPLVVDEATMSLRGKLASAVHIPTDKGWMPAVQCYAGSYWGGPSLFDNYFVQVENRGVVEQIGRWPNMARKGTEKKDWIPLFKSLGVSWELKLRRITDPSQIGRPDFWQSYRESVIPSGYYTNQDSFIEDFPECVGEGQSLNSLLEVILPLETPLQSNLARFSNRKTTYYPASNSSIRSFADFQLKRGPWLPCRQSLLYQKTVTAPRHAYFPERGLNGLLPEVNRGTIDNERWFGTVIPFLRVLGVNENLPDQPRIWHGWMKKLEESSRVYPPDEFLLPKQGEPDSTGGLIWNAAQGLYREYFKREFPSQGAPSGLLVPCITWRNGRQELGFFPSGEVYWVDEPHFDPPEVRNCLLAEGFNLFILRLGTGAKAPERFGIVKLSDHVEVCPEFDEFFDELSKDLTARFIERRVAILKALRIHEGLPESITFEAVSILHLVVKRGEKPLATTEILGWPNLDGGYLINATKDPFRGVAY
ncbi:MAG: hypothetical protein ACRD2L_21570, partial [Terriglobia bacterium]